MRKILKKPISKLLILTLLLGLFGTTACANTKDPHADNMRGVWMSTIYNLDYPAVKNNVTAQKKEFIKKLDDLQKAGINTVVVQVRPSSDALYQSKMNPWSEVLTGVQGKDPGYDPMAFMIEESHKRGMSFHAWMNPYRITTIGKTDISLLSDNHPAKLHPDWVITYGNALYYNPDLPQVRQYISDTVKEVVDNYDVDGIHFDDYFYPSNYPIPEGENRDGLTANQRRANVDLMVKMAHDAVKQSKPDVLFGISPMGIWKNNTSDPKGSATKGSEGYYSVFSDATSWIKAGTVDYIVPQIYWETGFAAADYETLVKWWANQVKGTDVKLYIGQGVYRDPVATQIDTQLEINKKYSQVKGSIFFSTRDLLNNRMGALDKVTSFYAGKPLPAPDPTPAPAPAANISALATTSKILVNGKSVAFEAYNIKDNNYFKLRDLAATLTKEGMDVEISWDEPAQTIDMQLGKPYTSVGGELAKGDGKDKKANAGTVKLLLNGKEAKAEAYLINGNHYYKLRDLSILFGFEVDYKDETVVINTN